MAEVVTVDLRYMPVNSMLQGEERLKQYYADNARIFKAKSKVRSPSITTHARALVKPRRLRNSVIPERLYHDGIVTINELRGMYEDKNNDKLIIAGKRKHRKVGAILIACALLLLLLGGSVTTWLLLTRDSDKINGVINIHDREGEWTEARSVDTYSLGNTISQDLKVVNNTDKNLYICFYVKLEPNGTLPEGSSINDLTVKIIRGTQASDSVWYTTGKKDADGCIRYYYLGPSKNPNGKLPINSEVMITDGYAIDVESGKSREPWYNHSIKAKFVVEYSFQTESVASWPDEWKEKVGLK